MISSKKCFFVISQLLNLSMGIVHAESLPVTETHPDLSASPSSHQVNDHIYRPSQTTLEAQTKIGHAILKAWKIPLNSSGLLAVARFSITENGSIATAVIVRSSGDESFDNSIKALTNLNGIPVPDDSKTFEQVKFAMLRFKAP